jgi:hypothetical protein
MRLTTVALLCVASSGWLGCAPADDGTLDLAPGQEARVDETLRLKFIGVSSDSRCPTDGDCFWPGNGAVEIGLTVGADPIQLFTLNTYLDPKSVDFAGYHVSLVELTPYPGPSAAIAPNEYRAHLLVTRTPDTP